MNSYYHCQKEPINVQLHARSYQVTHGHIFIYANPHFYNEFIAHWNQLARPGSILGNLIPRRYPAMSRYATPSRPRFRRPQHRHSLFSPLSYHSHIFATNEANKHIGRLCNYATSCEFMRGTADLCLASDVPLIDNALNRYL